MASQVISLIYGDANAMQYIIFISPWSLDGTWISFHFMGPIWYSTKHLSCARYSNFFLCAHNLLKF